MNVNNVMMKVPVQNVQELSDNYHLVPVLLVIMRTLRNYANNVVINVILVKEVRPIVKLVMQIEFYLLVTVQLEAGMTELMKNV